jgi:hypothetical protein
MNIGRVWLSTVVSTWLTEDEDDERVGDHPIPAAATPRSPLPKAAAAHLPDVPDIDSSLPDVPSIDGP